jgi:hypothetical protein
VAKIPGPVAPVVCQQDVEKHVAHIDDSPINIEEDQQLLGGKMGPCFLIVNSEFPHPVSHYDLPHINQVFFLLITDIC